MMSRDMILSTTVAPCANSVRCVSDGLLGIGGRKCRHHRDLVGLKQPLDLDRVKPLAAIGKRRGNDPPRRLDIGRKIAGHGRRDLRQRRHHFAMLHQMHEAADRIVLGRIVGDPGAAQHVADLLVGADPGREHRLGRVAALLAVFPDHAGHGRRDVVARRNRGLNIHDQDRIVGRIGQQDLERRRIARRIGIANDIDGI